jgi:3-phosphoshikimate 1-carboxyvinyltransferase
MALPLIDENSSIRVIGELQSRPYVDMTIDVLKKSGIDVFEDEPGVFYIPGGQEYRLSGEHEVSGDWSSAAMWLSMGAAAPEGSILTVIGLDPDSLHGDRAITDILKGMGSELMWDGNDIILKAHGLRSRMIDARDIPDLVPAIAVAACMASGKTVIMNAERLRLKESDRLRAISSVLKTLGVMVNERPDGLEIFGGYRLKGGRVSSFSDHRIAMMAACLRGQTDGDIIIEGAEAVMKSYPGFFDDYRSLGGEAEEI